MGIFDSGRSVYSCDHGITADHEKYRRSIEIRTGFLQRRKFRTGSRKITVFRIVLPSAVPGILAGVILAIGRIVGETAALIYTAGTVAKVPKNVLSSGRTLAVHMYNLSSEGLYMNQAYAVSVVLLIFVLLINWGSGKIAKKLTKGKE
mgnify:CR=1 FL=1